MDHKTFFDEVKKGNIASCYVFEGPEEYTKRFALDSLRRKLLPEGMEDMNETRLRDPDANAVIAAAETLPFMADKRLVVIHESAMLQGKAKEYDEAKNAQELADYLKDIPDTSCLVFYVREKADARKKLYLALKKKAVMVQFDALQDKEMTQWIAQQLKKLDKKIAASTCQKLVFTVGSDLHTLSGEIQKLAACAGEREEITEQDIDDICIKSTAYRVFDLASALLRGDAKRAFTLSQALLRDGEEELGLLALLHSECRKMLSVKILRTAGMSPDMISAKIGIRPQAARLLSQAVAQYTDVQLKKMTDVCMETDYSVKSGRCAAAGSLEKTMLQLLKIRAEGR